MTGADAAGVAVDERGFIAVDKQMRTNVPHIFAIGDVVGQPMLAHKAVQEAKVAAEVAAGRNSVFDAKVVPSVAYTDPEVAWVGLTEIEAKARGVKYGKGVFPRAASGRSLSLGRDEGVTKILFDEEHERIIGCGIVGPSAGDLIAEAALAIEMGADAADIGLTIIPIRRFPKRSAWPPKRSREPSRICTCPERDRAGADVMTTIPPSTDAQGYLENLMRAGQEAMKQFDDALVAATGLRTEDSLPSEHPLFPLTLIADLQREYLKQMWRLWNSMFPQTIGCSIASFPDGGPVAGSRGSPILRGFRCLRRSSPSGSS